MLKVVNILSFLLITFFFLSCTNQEDIVSNLAQLDSFKIYELKGCVFENEEDASFNCVVADGTPLNDLTAIFTCSNKAEVFLNGKRQASGYTKNDFSAPLQYTVVAEDGTSKNYTITVHTDGEIRSFSIVELPSTIFQFDSETYEFSASVIADVDLSSLTASFEIPTNSSVVVNGVVQESGVTINSFANPVDYTLKMNDGLEKEYQVVLTQLPNQAPTAVAGDDISLFLSEGVSEKEVSLDASSSSDEETEFNELTFSWKYNGGEISSERTTSVSLPEGQHTIVLEVTDESGATDLDEIVVTVAKLGEAVAVDADATAQTKALLQNLHNIANSPNFLFGQEFPMSFQLNQLRTDLSTSDCKEVTGDHPAVFGIDPHYLLYKTAQQRQVHIDEAKYAYNQGAVVTIDFHQQSKNDHQIYLDKITSSEDKSLLYDIVKDKNNARAFFEEEMDEILDLINNDFGFPVVFRLYHEMDGNWFWWGSSATNASPSLYQEFYQYSVEYIKARTNWVLFAWSPNGELREEYYPGDAYVDLVGFDLYEPSKATLKTRLIALSTFTAKHNKVAALTETGYRNDYINTQTNFWTESILSAIEEGGDEIRIAWVLAWFNATWASGQQDLFIPNKNSPEKAMKDFIEFEKSATTLFLEDVKSMNIYN